MVRLKTIILILVISFTILSLKAQDSPLANLKPAKKPIDIYICVKESFYLPKTNSYIYFFPNTTVLIGINVNSSNSFFSLGPSFTQDRSLFYGFNVNYRYINSYGVSPNNFIFNCGFKYLYSEYYETEGNNYYNHEFRFRTFYLGIGYKRFLGKNQRLYIAPMANLSLNFFKDNFSTNAKLSSNNPSGYYQVKLDGLLAAILEFEIGVRLNKKKN